MEYVIVEDNQFKVTVMENGDINFEDKYRNFPYCSWCGNFETNLSEHMEICNRKNINDESDYEWFLHHERFNPDAIREIKNVKKLIGGQNVIK